MGWGCLGKVIFHLLGQACHVVCVRGIGFLKIYLMLRQLNVARKTFIFKGEAAQSACGNCFIANQILKLCNSNIVWHKNQTYGNQI